jgi:hypothetical protein
MSAEPGAPEEEGDEPANKRYAGNVARLAVANLKQQVEEQLEAVSKANGEHVQRAIEHLKWELKQERDSECLEHERAESSKRLNRSVEWSIRFVSGVVGAGAMMLIVVAASQCSELHERIRTLEFNQSKTK